MISIRIPLLSPILYYFKVYYKYSGKNLFFLCCIIFIGGISEGFGISMLLPVLDYETKDQISNPYSQAIYEFIELLGFEVALSSLLTLLFIAFLLKGLFYATQALLASYITTNLVKEMKSQIYHNYTEMKYEYFTNKDIGYLNNTVTTEVETAVGSLSSYIDIIVSIIYILIYVLAAFLINPYLTLIVIILCTILFVALRVLVRMSRQYSILISKTNAEIQSFLIQTLNFFKYLKATDSFSHLKKEIYAKIKKRELLTFKNQVIKIIPYSMIEPSTVLFMSGLILFHVNYSEKRISEILISLLFFYKTFNRIFSFQTEWQKFNSKIGAIEVVEKASKDLLTHRDVPGLLSLNGFNNVIEFKDVSFSYGENIVLSNINISITKNKSIGIVGESGAGKTTIFDILSGLISPQSGKVIFDGTDYSDLDFLSLRKLLGYVTQDPVIINDTIANNISFWECDYREEICKAKVEKAAKLAKCESFIKETENGYEAVIGDKGVKLSGGQRQRISIARELFKEPEIIIFDEATSSLDSESELLIQNSINSIMGKCTIIIIAHRLSTIKKCDYIYVLKEGKLIEDGTFDRLYKNKDSAFSKMCTAQNL